jgi:hypothetical protein
MVTNGEEMMRREQIAVIVAGLLVVLAGCNPATEGLVKKTEASVQVGGVSPTEGDIGSVGSQLLDPSTRSLIHEYGRTIKEYAKAYGIDWRLVLAVIEAESGFQWDAESHKGAVGLMQLMPATSAELDARLDIEVLADPDDNIHGGVYYLRKLYDMFDGAEPSDRIMLTLAAYNAGVGRVYDAQLVGAYLHEDPTKWETVRDALPLLSKRYYTLHKNIWEEGRPKAGWFGNAGETVAYVGKTMECYDEYRLILN